MDRFLGRCPRLSSGRTLSVLHGVGLLLDDACLLSPVSCHGRFALYLLLINLPFGIVTALVARAIIGEQP